MVVIGVPGVIVSMARNNPMTHRPGYGQILADFACNLIHKRLLLYSQ